MILSIETRTDRCEERNMKLICTLEVVFLIVLATFSGCGGPKFSAEVSPAVDLAEYETFAFASIYSGTNVDESAYALAISYVKSELEAKGYREADSNEASFTVLALTRISEQVDRSAYGESYRDLFDTYHFVKLGEFHLKMVDPRTSQWLWSGTMEKLWPKDRPGESEESRHLIRKSIHSLLKDFPVRK
jgi:hypothetical protein